MPCPFSWKIIRYLVVLNAGQHSHDLAKGCMFAKYIYILFTIWQVFEADIFI